MWTAAGVLLLLLISSVLGSCPEQCRCQELEEDILRVANCNNVSLTELPEGDLQDTYFIDLSFNNITTLENDAFKEKNWLQIGRLYLNNNGLKTIEEHAFRGLTHLQILNLAKNHITKLHPDIFSTNTELEALSLNGNENIQLPETGFNLPQLNILSLIHCGLTNIPPKFFQNMTALHLVFLQSNELTKFDPLLVSSLPQLGQLDLRDNLFTSLPLDLLNVMPQSLMIRMEGNPFKCTCAMADANSLYQSRHFHENLTCLDPRGTAFLTFFRSQCTITEPSPLPSSSPPPVTTTVTTTTTTITTAVTTTVTQAIVNDTTTTAMPVPVTHLNLWWVIVGIALAALILIAIVVVIKRKRFARGYTVHRTFTVLDDEEEQNFIT